MPLFWKYNNSQSVVTSGGLGTMGFPADIVLLSGGLYSLFLVGDGGLQMSIQN